MGQGLLRAVGQRRERVPDEVAPFVQGPPGHGEHQLGVGRRAVAVHPELARGDAAAAQGHALGVPERERGVHAPGHEARDRGEADGHPAHPGQVAAVARDHRLQHGVVRGQPGHTHAAPLQVTRAAYAGAGDHRGEGPLHERADPHQVLAALPGQPEVVDVHHRDVRPARAQELQRVRGRRGHAHLQVHAVALVRAVPDRGVDAGMHRVRLEVQRQTHVADPLLLLAATGQGEDQRRGRPRSGRGGRARPRAA